LYLINDVLLFHVAGFMLFWFIVCIILPSQHMLICISKNAEWIRGHFDIKDFHSWHCCCRIWKCSWTQVVRCNCYICLCLSFSPIFLMPSRSKIGRLIVFVLSVILSSAKNFNKWQKIENERFGKTLQYPQPHKIGFWRFEETLIL
jgi:hypothetical protein